MKREIAVGAGGWSDQERIVFIICDDVMRSCAKASALQGAAG